MILHDESTWLSTAFSLHDCVAENITFENGKLSFYFLDGILISEKYAPQERHTPIWQTGPAKITFSDADMRFFRVFSGNIVQEYPFFDVMVKVSSGEWSLDFDDEYRSYRAVLFSGVLRKTVHSKITFDHFTFALDYSELTCEWNEDEIPDNGVDLFADNLHFLGRTDEERQYDFCLHGNVTLRINGRLAVDSMKCCVTASALRFLRTLYTNHNAGEDEEYLFPCCGNMLIPSENGRSVTIIGCPNGTDISIERKCNLVHIVAGQIDQYVPYEEYKSSVLAFAKQIFRFIQNSPERLFTNDREKRGYEAFICEYTALLKKVNEYT